jgi:hypothetical protein
MRLRPQESSVPSCLPPRRGNPGVLTKSLSAWPGRARGWVWGGPEETKAAKLERESKSQLWAKTPAEGSLGPRSQPSRVLLPPLFFPSFRGRRWEEGGRGGERGTPVSPTPPLSSLFLSLPGGGEGEGCGGGTKPEGGLVKTEKAIKHSAGSVRPTPEHP